MTTEDPGQNESSGLPVPQYGEHPKDTPLGQAQGDELELDAYGLPVQDRPARSRVYLGMTASSVCALISASLLIVARTSHNYYNFPAWQVWLGAGAGLLASFLAMGTLNRAKKEKQLGMAGQITLRAIVIVGFLGFIGMIGVLQGPLCDTC
jgi:hypothetical protein